LATIVATVDNNVTMVDANIHAAQNDSIDDEIRAVNHQETHTRNHNKTLHSRSKSR
jgi:hypothetical protein